MRMASDSRKLIVEKAQQVPLLAWFLIEVIGISFTVVNVSEGEAGAAGWAGWAFATSAAERAAMATRMDFFMISIVLIIVQLNKFNDYSSKYYISPHIFPHPSPSLSPHPRNPQ